MNWSELVGKKIVAFRGYTHSVHGRTSTPLDYILFDDNETFLSLSTQDSYAYHDCSSSARELSLGKDAKFWQHLLDKSPPYNEPDNLAYPF